MSIILYFSPNCGNCQEFLNRLSKQPELYQKVNQAQAGKHRFPSYVLSVPTIQIPDPKNPSKAIIYEGDDAFEWLDDQTGGNKLMEYDPLAMGGVFGGSAFAGVGDQAAVPNLTMADAKDPNSGRIGVQQPMNNGGVDKSQSAADHQLERMMMMREKDTTQMMNQGRRSQGPPPPM